MKVTLQEGDVGTFLLVAEDGRSILVQTDWDFPGVASTFGWSPRDADMSEEAFSDMVADAREFLHSRAGDSADDPGYF